MVKLNVAICGAGIAGLCLAVELQKDINIRVDIYEAASKIEEIQTGANITLWGRVCEVLRLMDLSEDCIRAAMAAASKGSPSPKFRLRGSQHLDSDFGSLSFRAAWSLKRADIIHILRKRIYPSRLRLGKRLTRYISGHAGLKLEFEDGGSATCDLLIGCDGIRSVVRAQMMREYAEITQKQEYLQCSNPRWTGTVVYRSLIPSAQLAQRFPKHPVLSGGQIYLGRHQHIIAQPMPGSVINVAVSVTFSPQEGQRWPSQTWSSRIDKATCKLKIGRHFVNWEPEAREIVDSIDTAVECAVMDIEPLPYFVKGCVALLGDAAHAAVPYLAANAALAIEDAFVLGRIIRHKLVHYGSLRYALEAYQFVRRPYGNKHLINARLALQEFEYRGPSGNNPARATESIRKLFDQTVALLPSRPDADVKQAIAFLETKLGSTSK